MKKNPKKKSKKNKETILKKYRNYEYGYEFKEKLNKQKIYNKEKSCLEEELRIEIAKRKSLTKNIKNLPEGLQRIIYVFSIKRYWKDESLIPRGIPIWFEYLQYITKEKEKVYFKNIHFLHLEFNTLPENKKYISGCQCSFCLKEYKKIGDIIYLDQCEFVKENFGFREHEHYNMNYWNQYSDIIGGMRIFDPWNGDI